MRDHRALRCCGGDRRPYSDTELRPEARRYWRCTALPTSAERADAVFFSLSGRATLSMEGRYLMVGDQARLGENVVFNVERRLRLPEGTIDLSPEQTDHLRKAIKFGAALTRRGSQAEERI